MGIVLYGAEISTSTCSLHIFQNQNKRRRKMKRKQKQKQKQSRYVRSEQAVVLWLTWNVCLLFGDVLARLM